MAHTNQTVNSIGSGVRFILTANGDSYLVAAGVTVRSTNDIAVFGFAATGNRVQVNGLVESVTSLAISMDAAESELTIGLKGTVRAASVSPDNAVIYLSGGTSSINNLGRILGETTIGIVISGADNDIVNNGLIKGTSGVFFNDGPYSGNSFENFGQVSVNSFGDDTHSYRFNNGVLTEGADALVVNHKTGSISAISSEGAGVAITGAGYGSEVVNEGKISSGLWYGVDFFNLNPGASAGLDNSGRISGGAGSFRGNEDTDFVINTGTMKGDIVFNAGDDVLDGAKGKIVGDVSGGDGNDILETGKGNQAIDGGANDDLIDGGKDRDELRGGTGMDRFVFSTGYGKDEVLDFAGGTDVIGLSGWKAIKDFDDVLSHAHMHGPDLWIVAGKDMLILDNVVKGDLDEANFLF